MLLGKMKFNITGAVDEDSTIVRMKDYDASCIGKLAHADGQIML